VQPTETDLLCKDKCEWAVALVSEQSGKKEEEAVRLPVSHIYRVTEMQHARSLHVVCIDKKCIHGVSSGSQTGHGTKSCQ